jgi:hypothetical protein
MHLDPNQIKVLSITPEIPPDVSGGSPNQWLKILFRLGPGWPNFPVFVNRGNISNDNVVRVARHYLHMLSKALAETTAPWQLSEAQLVAIQQKSDLDKPAKPK